MSGLLNLLSGFLDKQGPSSLITVAQQVVEQNGGVQGLLNRFHQAGFGEHVQSWLNGDPKPLTGNQLSDVFSGEQLDHWASQIGVDQNMLKTILAEGLPFVMDYLTPNGQVPSETPNIKSLLKGFLGQPAD